MKQYLLGIDIGTSACKIAIFNRNGDVISTANGDYNVYYPHLGWAEQNPEEWWSAVCGAVKLALEKGSVKTELVSHCSRQGRKCTDKYTNLDGYKSAGYL